MFGLHPALASLKAAYDAKQLLALQNICSPYRDRSHFEGQNVLETGAAKAHALNDGWLNRALAPMGLGGGAQAFAVAQTPPLLLEGPARASSWMPQAMPTPEDAFLLQVKTLYTGDPMLGRALDDAMALQTAAMVAARASARITPRLPASAPDRRRHAR